MKALLLRKGKLHLEDMPRPVRTKGEALMKVLKAGICNADIEMAKGYVNLEGILGHEARGDEDID